MRYIQVVCLTSTATPQDFQLADPNDCTVFWNCRSSLPLSPLFNRNPCFRALNVSMSMFRWDGSTSLHTAVKGECSEGEIYRYLLILEKLRLFISMGVVVMLILY